MRHGRFEPGTFERRGQRGAAVFVVVLVIALVSGLGVFAVRSATTAIAASGHNRQLNQVHYVTDFGILATVALGGDNPEAVKQLMMKGPAPGHQQCVGYQEQLAANGMPTCMLMSYDDIEARVQAANGNSSFIDELGRPPPQALGRAMDADMRIELTDLHPSRPVTGHEVAGGSGAGARLRFAQVTVTVNGLVRPRQENAGTWDTESAAAASVESSRAHVIIGPVSF